MSKEQGLPVAEVESKDEPQKTSVHLVNGTSDDFNHGLPPFIIDFVFGMEKFILPGEDIAGFLDIYDSYEECFKPKGLIEYRLVLDCTMLTWEIFRYRRMKLGIMINNRRAAVESFLRKIHGGAPLQLKGETEKLDLAAQVKKYFSDPEYRKGFDQSFERIGLSPDAVEVEAFQRSITSLASVEKLFTAAQRSLTVFTKDLERRFSQRGAKLRQATELRATSEKPDEEQRGDH